VGDDYLDLTRRDFTRRKFLGGLGAMTAITATFGHHPALMRSIAATLDSDQIPLQVKPVTPAQPVLTITAERPVDLALVDFTFYGFTVNKSVTPTELVATTKATSTTWVGVTAKLPPQAIAEGSYYTPPLPSGETLSFDPTPVLSQVSGPTILAFTFATGSTIPLPTMTVADLLDWSGWNLYVPTAAIIGSGSISPLQPLAFQTQIECPIDLLLAPVVDETIGRSGFTTHFEGPTEPLTSAQQVTECWGTNLVSSEYAFDVPTTPIAPAVAAVWSNDYLEPADDGLTLEAFIEYTNYVFVQ
jgi:hypothetical protein